MIQYTTGRWSLRLLLHVEGSVFPKALVWSIPAAIVSALFHYLWFEVWQKETLQRPSAFGAVWSGFAFVLGFLTVFRTQQAHSRYWEGATSIQQARANFFNAYSSVIAFCARETELRHRVEEFQHLLVRLMSMLHCVALQNVVLDQADGRKFEFFSMNGIDSHALRFLTSQNDFSSRSEIIMQWVQRLVLDGSRDGTIDVPPPILSRFFQELSQGALQIINARNMTAIPFPFPYAQLLTMLMFAFWVVSPIFFALILHNIFFCSFFSLLTTFAFWCTHYIAAELESPFGDDPNDLPLFALQRDMNKSLWSLLDPLAQQVPKFEFDKIAHREWDVSRELPEECHCRDSGISGAVSQKTWMHARGDSSYIIAELRRLSTRIGKKVSLHSSDKRPSAATEDSVPAIPEDSTIDLNAMTNISSEGAFWTVQSTMTTQTSDCRSPQHGDRRSPQHGDRGDDMHAEAPATPLCLNAQTEVSLDEFSEASAKKVCIVSPTDVSLDDFADGFARKPPDVVRDLNDYVHQLSTALKSLIGHTIQDLQLLQASIEWTGIHGPRNLDRLRVTSGQETQMPDHVPAIRTVSFQGSAGSTHQHLR